jgi:hypothetical protein
VIVVPVVATTSTRIAPSTDATAARALLKTPGVLTCGGLAKA